MFNFIYLFFENYKLVYNFRLTRFVRFCFNNCCEHFLLPVAFKGTNIVFLIVFSQSLTPQSVDSILLYS